MLWLCSSTWCLLAAPSPVFLLLLNCTGSLLFTKEAFKPRLTKKTLFSDSAVSLIELFFLWPPLYMLDRNSWRAEEHSWQTWKWEILGDTSYYTRCYLTCLTEAKQIYWFLFCSCKQEYIFNIYLKRHPWKKGTGLLRHLTPVYSHKLQHRQWKAFQMQT